jgi:signal transduction histidine kinase
MTVVEVIEMNVEPTVVLNVDDYDPARYARTRALARGGFRVVEAADGAGALRAARETRPSLVVLDVNLPDMSGIDVCRRLKSDPAMAPISVLQVSAAMVSDEHRVSGLNAGADAYLTEPIDPPVLVATVNALLRMRRAEEEALAANRAKDEFVATLSHELRTPLTSIVGWVRMLREGKLDGARAAQALATIERNALTQVRLIDDLLDVSRIVSGSLRLHIGRITPREIVDNALASMRPAIQAKGLCAEIVADPAMPAIAGDAVRLQQVIWNLVSNAVKFTPAGGTIRIIVDRDDDHVSIAISDSGEGIDPAFLPHVFERFRQAPGVGTRQGTGLGLGLWVVRQVVELHGGTVAVASEGRGRGATFTVRLPIDGRAPAPHR